MNNSTITLTIHCLDQSDTILTFCIHLVVPHDYVISFSVNKFYRKQRCTRSDSLSYHSKGFLSHVLRHTDYRIADVWLN